MQCVEGQHSTQSYRIPPGKHQKYSITVGPYNRRYWKCGSTTNVIAKRVTVLFTCDRHAKGYAVKITLTAQVGYLVLCEVTVLGEGMTS